ncbi:5-formyltetrahydrofolate cyclo-ligase [Algoriphagus boseongensis]|uniref:5-formyltetrahydrofolate cyclo-ligase n=1 Tax=Algoriphagus boseongensis TaxID=1442587 RepID=A0A4R6T591_9BACT|nr:5-formyltetrahydrofolate cyclo-ligase [Algoriphagus boseongensis]TDQ17503.1 5-formyltetrahydrofolate cyclo-ligase [Algoriphagus boseongensis]
MKAKTKAELRSEYRQLRKGLSSEKVQEMSRDINHRFLEWLSDHPELNHFHLFFPMDRFNEVNTFYIKESLEEMDKVLYTSQTNKEETALETLKLPKQAEFFLDEWGIPVPQESIKVSPTKVQLVFVPLLAYDPLGNRVGFGKGYYDSFLSKLDSGVIKIGLSFFPPEEKIEPEAHDVPLDYCITPEKVFSFSKQMASN